MTPRGFDIDLPLGEAGERSLLGILTERDSKVEVKREFKSRGTGNVFVEFAQHGNVASGIQTSEAGHWAFEYDAGCWLIVPKDRLLQVARECYRKYGSKPGGDNGNVGVLVPLVELLTDAARRRHLETVRNQEAA